VIRRARSPLLLLESDPWRRESLVAFLEGEGFDVVTEDAPGARAPEFVLLDLDDEPGSPTARIERVRLHYPEAKVVAFVREVNARTTFPCLMAGVKGILPHSAGAAELRHAIRCIREGSLWTPRAVLSEWVERVARLGLGAGNAFTRSEQRVLEAVRDELPNKEIARRLGVTEATVKFHVGKLLKKTGAADRRELGRFASETLPALAGGNGGDRPVPD
jgi:DNA-binding NarL/FixJ family response regulator